jgi:hypothetical protein
MVLSICQLHLRSENHAVNRSRTRDAPLADAWTGRQRSPGDADLAACCLLPAAAISPRSSAGSAMFIRSDPLHHNVAPSARTSPWSTSPFRIALPWSCMAWSNHKNIQVTLTCHGCWFIQVKCAGDGEEQNDLQMTGLNLMDKCWQFGALGSPSTSGKCGRY